MVAMWGRWPLLDQEIIRLDVASKEVYTAIRTVCTANGLKKPSASEYVMDTCARIEAELQAQADTEIG